MNSLKAIACSDLHINKYAAFGDNRNRLEDCLLVLNDVYTLARKKKAKVILMSGDFYDTVKYLFTVVINDTIDRLTTLIYENPDIVWYAITGNHDFATQNLPTKPAISALTHLATIFPDNFIVLDNAVEKLDTNVYIAGIPNYKYKEHYQEQLQKMHDKIALLRKDRPDVKVTLMIHQKPNGHDNPNVTVDTNVHDELYDIFDLVICGDVHSMCRIIDKFVLLGNPLHRDLADEGLKKGIWSLDLTKPSETLKFHDRKGRYPQFIRVNEDELHNYDDTQNFLIPIKSKKSTTNKGVADIEKYSSYTSPEQIIRHFWGEKGEGDERLLKAGLSFIF